MDREANIDSIRALEQEIMEHERAIAKLKRARNSLLNVSKLPPEVLGNIFRYNVTLRGDFGGLEKGSHNFLLVCHHWSEVASRTPELWSFWGNAPGDWARWYRRSGTAPLDLVLGGYGYTEGHFDATLRDVFKDRATRDTIRRVHLSAGGTGLVNSILSSLIPDCDEVRSNSVESFILFNQSKAPVNVSKFFAHYRFPKLERLALYNCSISSWDHLTSRTSALTTLELDFTHPSTTPSPTPAVSQLLSILSSNPALRKVVLLKRAVPDSDGDGGSEPSSRVQLPHLKELRLDGGLRHVFNILHRLDHPGNMDLLSLMLHDCDNADVSQIVGPYLRDHIGGRDKAQNGLNLSVSSGYRTYRAPHVALRLGKAGGTNYSDQAQMQIGTFIAVTMLLNGNSRDMRERIILDLIDCTPREEIVYFKGGNNPIATKDSCTQLSNLKALSYDGVPLSAAFPNPNLVGEKIFPSLEYVSLERIDEEGWSPLITYLADRVSSGNKLDTLVISDSPDMPSDVEDGLRGMVRELKVDRSNSLLRLLGASPPDPF